MGSYRESRLVRRLRYTDDAKTSLGKIATYIAQESHSRRTAVQFTNRLRDQCQKLAALPGTLGRARPELRADIRSFPCQGYVIFFRYLGDVLEVVNILHGSRDIEGYF
jgi:toxin ParE1/3/4